MIQTHQQSAPQAEWKFNVVVYGIPDCQHGHNKFTRTTEDLNKVTDILLKIEAEPSVQDCFHLGSYSHNNTWPQPVLVKLSRSIDAINII